MEQIVQVLELLALEKHLKVICINDRFSHPARGWADVAIYMFYDIGGKDGVVCELQITHKKMMLIREQMGAHDSYDESRLASELRRSRDYLEKALPKSSDVLQLAKKASTKFKTSRIVPEVLGKSDAEAKAHFEALPEASGIVPGLQPHG